MKKIMNKSSDIPTTKPTVTNNTNETNVTNVTNNTNACVTCVVCDKGLAGEIFGENTFEKIMVVLATEEETFTYDKIAEVLKKTEVSIRQVVTRKKDYFTIKKPDGKICHISLSQIAINEINQRITKFESEKKQKIRQQTLHAQELINQEKDKESILILTKQLSNKREGNKLPIDFNELLETDYKLADKLLEYPERIIESFVKQYEGRYHLKFTNLPSTINTHIENLRHQDFNKLSAVEGRVVSFGEVRPITTEIVFECPSCGAELNIKQNYRKGIIKNPESCLCGRKKDFYKKSKKRRNCSYLRLEDLQEKTDNPSPQRVKAIIFDGLCEGDQIKTFTPGNEIKCYGILKEVVKQKNGQEGLVEDFIFEILGAEPIEKDIDISKFTEEEVREINELSAKINEEGLNPLIKSFAPDIHGYDSIKGALTLQLCNRINDYKNKTIRNKSNILLIGDPGVAKSILCKFAIDVTRGGRIAVGGGSSAVGITASVVREEESIGGYRVEPGAMILAKDLLFLDEMNNLQEEDKSKLQEGMSEQKVSINKANIHCEMKVTCGIIAAANPKDGNFKDIGFNVEDQFNIPTPILNRFDTIFVLRDIVDEENDKKIADKMIKRHREKLKYTYNKPFLRNFFAYIKKFEEPEINDNVEKILQKVYFTARKYNDMGVKINPRFLEAVNRMAIASAKIRLSSKVEFKDIERTLNIIKDSQYKIDTKLILRELNQI